VILEAEMLVLAMLYIDLGGVLQRLGPMEVAGSFTPIDENLWVSIPVNNPHNVPIGLCTIGHEAFEVGLGDSMAGHEVVEVMPKKNLSILVFGLEVAASDGHDALVGSVVYVAGHGVPPGHAFDMVGHDPSMLKIPARLHALNQADPTTRADLRHLKNKKIVGFVTLA
jgi:hypothetical protein